MSVYTPDKWVVVRVTTKSGEQVDKVLGGWYGGFAGSDHWRLNSGIESVKECNDRFEFYGYSGSVYVCYKPLYGLTHLTAGLLKGWTDRNINIDILEEYDVRPKR